MTLWGNMDAQSCRLELSSDSGDEGGSLTQKAHKKEDSFRPMRSPKKQEGSVLTLNKEEHLDFTTEHIKN